MSDEEEVEGEEGEEKKEELAETKPPSIVQIKLAEQGKYVAGKFDLLFATTAKIEVNDSIFLCIHKLYIFFCLFLIEFKMTS